MRSMGLQRCPAHVLTEAYAVLTRLPGGLAVPPEGAAAVLALALSVREPLQLAAAERLTLLSTLAAAGVGGGASLRRARRARSRGPRSGSC